MIKLDETTVPEVGKYYLVQCALIMCETSKFWIPIIGPPHRDPQFGFHHKHYHIDGRFISNSCVYPIRISDGKTANVLLFEDVGPSYLRVLEIDWKKKKCVNPSTGLPKLKKTEKYFPPSNWKEFQDSYKGKSCAGKKCPHYGQHMHEVDGNLVCPLHGLIGDMETEIIIGGIIPNR